MTEEFLLLKRQKKLLYRCKQRGLLGSSNLDIYPLFNSLFPPSFNVELDLLLGSWAEKEIFHMDHQVVPYPFSVRIARMPSYVPYVPSLTLTYVSALWKALDEFELVIKLENPDLMNYVMNKEVNEMD